MVRKAYEPDVLNGHCPSQQVLEVVGDKWSVLVLYLLSRHKTLRYSELQRRIGGVSQKMLTQTLRELERSGLLSRKVFPVVPPRVEYSLTPLGGSLQKTLRALCHWSQDHMNQVFAARERWASRQNGSSGRNAMVAETV